MSKAPRKLKYCHACYSSSRNYSCSTCSTVFQEPTTGPDYKAIALELMRALEKIETTYFCYTMPCECCDNGYKKMKCTCFDYDIGECYKDAGEITRAALSSAREKMKQ